MTFLRMHMARCTLIAQFLSFSSSIHTECKRRQRPGISRVFPRFFFLHRVEKAEEVRRVRRKPTKIVDERRRNLPTNADGTCRRNFRWKPTETGGNSFVSRPIFFVRISVGHFVRRTSVLIRPPHCGRVPTNGGRKRPTSGGRKSISSDALR